MATLQMKKVKTAENVTFNDFCSLKMFRCNSPAFLFSSQCQYLAWFLPWRCLPRSIDFKVFL